MERVVGIGEGEDAVAIVRTKAAEEQVVAIDVNGAALVVFHSGGQASALDTGQIAEGEDIGSIGVFAAVFDGQELDFTAAEGVFTDTQTGSTWNVLGEAVAGPLDGERLEPVEHLDTFWFAWVAFQPETTIIQ